MNTYIILFFSVIATAFLISCGDDTTVTNNNNPDPPTADDSTIKLYSPDNMQTFNIGDTIKFIWSKGFATSYGFHYIVDSGGFNNTSGLTDTFRFVYNDTIAFYNVSSYQWYIWPYVTGCVGCETRYQSERRIIFFNH